MHALHRPAHARFAMIGQANAQSAITMLVARSPRGSVPQVVDGADRAFIAEVVAPRPPRDVARCRARRAGSARTRGAPQRSPGCDRPGLVEAARPCHGHQGAHQLVLHALGYGRVACAAQVIGALGLRRSDTAELDRTQ